MIRSRAGLLCLISTISLTAQAAEKSDSSTQRNDMHSCPTTAQGFLSYVTGYDASKNLLMCQDNVPYTTPKVPSNEHVDGRSPNPPTQEQGMHACPGNQVVTGIRVDRNELTCVDLSAVTVNTAQERLDPEDTTECHWQLLPFPQLPRWVCSTVRQPPTIRNGVHVCKTDEVMHGINVSDDRLLCVKFFGVLH